MKRKFKIRFIAAVCAVTAVFFAFAGCAGDEIRLQSYDEPLDFHTDLQRSYLEGDYDAIGVYAAGVEELSRPEAIRLEWTDPKKSDSYTVEIAESEDFSQYETYAANTNAVEIFNLKIATEYYWRVRDGETVSETGRFLTSDCAPRNLYVDGVTNVRDVGGWKTADGARVRQGLLYRGGRLNKSDVNDDGYKTEPTVFVPEITAAGAETFTKTLKIKTEVDFRLSNRNGYPAGYPLKSAVDGVNYVPVPMSGNASILDNASALKQLMSILADENNYPVYFHCNIGTDRTGMVAYLLGALCGVEKEDLLRDYLFSNFGNIGEAKAPSNSKNIYVQLLDDQSQYPGDTLKQRAESYFRSIGVAQETCSAVRDILLGA